MNDQLSLFEALRDCVARRMDALAQISDQRAGRTLQFFGASPLGREEALQAPVTWGDLSAVIEQAIARPAPTPGGRDEG